LQQKVELQTPYGRVEVVALRPSDEKLSAVLVNVGCYYTLADSGYIIWINMVYSWQMCASHNVTYVERIGQKPVVEIFDMMIMMASKDTLERVEGPRYVAQGYAYVLWRATGPLEEVADQVFQRWRDDASVVLDWLGEQPWCHSAPSNGILRF